VGREMRVFISWSGEHSEQVARVLRDWLPTVLQSVEPWVSSEDIAKGQRWSPELQEALRTASFGILCINPGNAREPWVNFEAGAMSNAIDSLRVSPLLAGIEPHGLPGTLSQFQCTRLNREDVQRLVHSINECLPSAVPKERVNRIFSLAWPDFQSQIHALDSAPGAGQAEGSPRTADDELPMQQQQILVLLGVHPDARPEAERIAASIGENPTRTQYHLDELKKRNLVGDLRAPLEPTRYYLSIKGRAFIVERNLI